MPRKGRKIDPLKAAGRDDRWMKVSPLNAKIGSRIKAEREKVGLSQTDVADFLGVKKNTVWRYEDGRFRIPAVVILMLAVQFGVPVQAFFPPTGDVE